MQLLVCFMQLLETAPKLPETKTRKQFLVQDQSLVLHLVTV